MGQGTGHEEATLSPFETAVIEVFVNMMHTLGLPKSYGDIYGLLYANPQPLAFTEIHERLDLSKGSVSGGLKALKEIGAIITSIRLVDRREVYAPELEIRNLLQKYLEERVRPQLESNIEHMERLDFLLSASKTNKGTKHILDIRLRKLSKWRMRATGLIPWILRFLR